MRLAYADPPYLGCCHLYQHRHELPWGCWDERGTWGHLLATLNGDYDGWALSLSSTSLYPILRICSYFKADVRVAAWVKPFAAYKRNVRIAYTWEPVIFKPGRDSSKEGAPVGRDHLSEPIQLRRGLTGAKPPRFCRWVLDLLGYMDGDTVDDLFPGTGVMGLVKRQGTLAVIDELQPSPQAAVASAAPRLVPRLALPRTRPRGRAAADRRPRQPHRRDAAARPPLAAAGG